jgi:hypothetical protein
MESIASCKISCVFKPSKTVLDHTYPLLEMALSIPDFSNFGICLHIIAEWQMTNYHLSLDYYLCALIYYDCSL